MSLFQFIASLVGSLVWPAVVIVAVLVLRVQIGTFLQDLGKRISKAEIAGFALSFHNVAAEASKIAAMVVPDPAKVFEVETAERTGDDEPTDGAVAVVAFDLPHLRELAHTDPRRAILHAWLSLVDAAAAAAGVVGWKLVQLPNRPTRLYGIAEGFANWAVFDTALVPVVEDLARLRDAAARRNEPIAVYDALNYVDAAWRVASAFVAAGREVVKRRAAGTSPPQPRHNEARPAEVS